MDADFSSKNFNPVLPSMTTSPAQPVLPPDQSAVNVTSQWPRTFLEYGLEPGR